MEFWNTFEEWFLGLGEAYHVNPLIFGGIYIGAVPFFSASLYLTIRNLRNKRSILMPALSTGLFFISAYLYLIIVGRNIPVWVYLFIGVMITYGAYATISKIKKKLKLKQ